MCVCEPETLSICLPQITSDALNEAWGKPWWLSLPPGGSQRFQAQAVLEDPADLLTDGVAPEWRKLH